MECFLAKLKFNDYELADLVLQKAFDSFAQGKGYITPEMVGTILRVMGQAFNEQTLRELISEVDEDGNRNVILLRELSQVDLTSWLTQLDFLTGSGQIEFAEFVILASKFIVEEDEETLQKELKEAFRLYDKEGKNELV